MKRRGGSSRLGSDKNGDSRTKRFDMENNNEIQQDNHTERRKKMHLAKW